MMTQEPPFKPFDRIACIGATRGMSYSRGTVTHCGVHKARWVGDHDHWSVYFTSDVSGTLNSLPADMVMAEAEYDLLQAIKGVTDAL